MISIQNVQHIYDSDTAVHLPDLDLAVGEHHLILGLSGSGKSTLLHILAGLLKPTQGRIMIDDTDIYSLSESARDTFRGNRIGIIFQQMHLIDSLPVIDNLRIARYMAGQMQNDDKIRTICEQLQISEKLHSFTDTLSQGQRQRVGIARAVMNSPTLILADEPTSSLDDKRADNVMQLLKAQAEQCNATLIISTHDSRVKSHVGAATILEEKVGEEA